MLWTFQSNTQDFPNLISPNTITTISYWEAGEVTRYHCVSDELKYKKGRKKPYKTEHKEYDITLSVEEELDSTYLMKMTYSNFKGDEKEGLVSEVYSIVDQLEIKYMISEVGTFDSIINKTELVEITNKVIDKILVDNSEISEEKKLVIKVLMDKLFTEENIEFLFAEDLLYIHGMYGGELTLNKTEEYEMYYPIINDQVINGDSKVILKGIDKSRNICRFSCQQSPNTEDIKNMLADLFRSFPTGDELNPSLDDMIFKSTIKLQYEMELSSGWMSQIKAKKTVDIKIDDDQNKIVKTNSYIKK